MKSIQLNFFKGKYELETKILTNIFYLKTNMKLTYVILIYNNNFKVKLLVSNYLKTCDYEYTEDQFYIYKFKLNDYYLIKNIIINIPFNTTNKKVFFEYDDDTLNELDLIIDNESEKSKKDHTKIIKKNCIEISPRKLYNEIEKSISIDNIKGIMFLDIHNLKNRNDIYVPSDKLDIKKDLHIIKIKLEDKYIDYLIDFSFYIDFEEEHYGNIDVINCPIEYISVL